MSEVEPADRTSGVHGVAAGKCGAGVLLGLQKIPDQIFFGVVGLAGIARRRTDAAVFFFDQCSIIKVLFRSVAPEFPADASMAVFRQSFGAAVAKCFDYYRVVVILLCFKFFGIAINPFNAADDSAAGINLS